MDPISNADRIVLMLRARLQERARSGGAAKARGRSGPQAPAEPSGLHALAATDGVDERTLRRALIQNLLADEFGPEFLNDASFQQIVSRVTAAIEADDRVAGLLARLIADLKSG